MLQIVLQPSSPTLSEETGAVSDSTVVIIFGVLFAVLLLMGLVVSLVRKLQRPELNGLTPDKIKQLWVQIRQSAKQGKLGQKIAVIEADKLLDNVLKSLLIPGETMGERLKMAAYKYPRIKDIWPAHKIRNQLVHETSFELQGEAGWVLDDYEQALRLLRVL